MTNRIVKDIRLVIFDVDGTLYNQKKLRFFMLIELFLYFLVRPQEFYQLKVLIHFRKEREKRSLVTEDNVNISHNQYVWCKEKVNLPLSEIKEIVEKWIHQRPLRYLPSCTYKKVKPLLVLLKKNDVKTAVYSDYKAERKLKAMGITVDYVYSSEQKEIDVLKPNPKGLNYIVGQLNASKSSTLFIGDRKEMDGMCAENAGILYAHISAGKPNSAYNDLIGFFKEKHV